MGASTGDLLVEDEPSLDRIIARIRRRAAFHSEDEARLRERAGLRRNGDASSHPVWRDEVAAMIATERLVRLAETHRKRIHVLHVSTAEEIEFLGRHKEWASVEVTPHHLTLVAPDCYERLGTFAQMNPPVRDERHRAAIWAGIASGVVDVLGSDHAPHTREEKEHAYPESHSGMTGVQTLVPIMLDHVNAGRLSLTRFVDLTSHGPARLFGHARQGPPRRGLRCRSHRRRHEADRNHHPQLDPVAQPMDALRRREVKGWPVGTFVRGRCVAWNGEILGPAEGEPVRFLEV